MGYKNKEQQRRYQREWIARRRQEWIDENGPCVDCKSVIDLEVDHVDPEKKRYQPSALWSMSKTNEKRIAELAKCVVRCSECHANKTSDQRPLPHGRWMYEKYGCRCELCIAAKKEHNTRREYDPAIQNVRWNPLAGS